jgi:tetratricopeptide (TPR) repeat protein
MNKKTIGLLMILLSTISTVSWAQSAQVQFLEGTVEYLNGKVWHILQLGQQVPNSATVRVQAKSLVEFKLDKSIISLRKPGTYNLASLTTKSNSNRQILNQVGTKLRALNEGIAGNRGETAVAAVRASRIPSPNPADMAEDSSADNPAIEQLPLALAEQFLAENQLELANAIVEEQLRVKPTNLNSFRLVQAELLIRQDRWTSAALNLEQVPIEDPNDPEWGNYRLVMARIYLHLEEFDAAITMVDEILATRALSSHKQYCSLIKGLAFAGKGLRLDAIDWLTKARNDNPDSPDGQLATEALTNI